MTNKFDIEKYQDQVLSEIADEIKSNNGGKQISRYEIVKFLSRSNGKNRPQREPREVTLLVKDGKKAYLIVHGEIKERKRGGIGPDVMAHEALGHLPEEERTVDKFLELVGSRKKRLNLR